MYDEKLKYGGSQDSFDFKLTIFYDLCTKAGINSDAYSSSFSTMLRDDALDYFYDSINNQEEHKQAMMTTWNSMSLKSIIKQNDEKSLLDCFEILLKKLRHTQRRLSSEFRSEKFLRDKVINACNNIEACAYACIRMFKAIFFT
ncbi:hypothetical protein Golomagni_06196 [Golovinomyces magnicellulatus]|nr:hypothetical protein Golomagni_06196 [Golovinomyces magnicellulatus]